jgi:membrane-associated protease RseP (regulator of RpoE activity)
LGNGGSPVKKNFFFILCFFLSFSFFAEEISGKNSKDQSKKNNQPEGGVRLSGNGGISSALKPQLDTTPDTGELEVEINLNEVSDTTTSGAPSKKYSFGTVSKTYIGIYNNGYAVNSLLKNQLNIDGGYVVMSVAPGGPAAKAGLRRYDIILSAEDQKIDDFYSLAKLVTSKKEGDELTLLLMRQGKKMRFKVVLKEIQGFRFHGFPTHASGKKLSGRKPGDFEKRRKMFLKVKPTLSKEASPQKKQTPGGFYQDLAVGNNLFKKIIVSAHGNVKGKKPYSFSLDLKEGGFIKFNESSSGHILLVKTEDGLFVSIFDKEGKFLLKRGSLKDLEKIETFWKKKVNDLLLYK